jgi:TPR repeat protein
VSLSALVLYWTSVCGCCGALPESPATVEPTAEPDAAAEPDAGVEADAGPDSGPTESLADVDVETGFEQAPPPYEELGARIRAQHRDDCDNNGDHLACYRLGKMLMSGEHGNQQHLRGWRTINDLTVADGLECTADRPEGCHVIGLLHEDNITGEYSRDAAAIYFSRAASALEESCRKGDAGACDLAAELYARNWGGAETLESVMETLSKLCLAGSAAGCKGYVSFISVRTGMKGAKRLERKHLRRQKRALKKRCRNGDAEGCVSLAWFHLVELTGKGPKKAIERLKDAFEIDPLRAYSASRGRAFVRKSSEVGRFYLETACQAGHAQACFQLGQAWRDGRVELETDTVALDALDRGCDGGNLDACRLAAEILEKDQSYERVRSFRLRACALSSSSDCDHLSALFDNGHGGEADPAFAKRATQRARVLDLRACDAGDPEACLRLAGHYEDRKLNWLYHDKAIKTRDRACHSGDSITCCSFYKLLVDRGDLVYPTKDDIENLWESCDCYEYVCCDVLEALGEDLDTECE